MLDQRRYMFGRRFLDHAMAEVEDHRPSAQGIQNSVGGIQHLRPAGQQVNRIEITLHR